MKSVARSLIGVAWVLAILFVATVGLHYLGNGVMVGVFGFKWMPFNDVHGPSAWFFGFLTILVSTGLTIVAILASQWDWTERVVDRLASLLPKKPPPLSELQKATEKDPDRAQRFL